MPCILIHCTYDCCLYIVFHARMVLFRFIFGMRLIGIWPCIYKMQRHYHYHVCMLSGNIEHLWWINLMWPRVCIQQNRASRATSGSWYLSISFWLPKRALRERTIAMAIEMAIGIEQPHMQCQSNRLQNNKHIARAYFIYFFQAHHFGKYICFIIIVYYWARNLAHSMRIVWLLLLW